MDVQREDVVSVIITLFLLGLWYLTLKLFNYPLISISVLWTGMIVLSLVYFYIYKKKNRDMKLFKTRFLISAIPIYPILGVYVYFLIIGEDLPNQLRLLPFFVIILMLILNASVVYISRKNE